MDYRTWRFSRKERLRYGLEALAVTGILAFCFYNSPWALAVFPLTAFWYFREKGEQLAEERRKELVKQVKKMGEESKVAARNLRREAMDGIKKMKTAKELSEDEAADCEDEVEKLVSKCVESIDKAVSAKEKELMTI